MKLNDFMPGRPVSTPNCKETQYSATSITPCSFQGIISAYLVVDLG